MIMKPKKPVTLFIYFILRASYGLSGGGDGLNRWGQFNKTAELVSHCSDCFEISGCLEKAKAKMDPHLDAV
jgi:hypothetical protein